MQRCKAPPQTSAMLRQCLSLFVLCSFKQLQEAEIKGRRRKSYTSKILSHCKKTQAISQGQSSSLEHLATFITSVKCHIHVFSISVSPSDRLAFWRWGDDSPHHTLPFGRGHSAPLTEFFTRKTHTNTRLDNPSLCAPHVAWLCFCLCKITVVQVSSKLCHVDRQARKRTAKHLCLPQRSFLSYNWLSCPAWSFGYQTRSSSRSHLHLPEEHRRQLKVLFKMSGKVASSFKGPGMYMAHGF